MKTTLRQNIAHADRKWYLVDANGLPLGKVATRISSILSGKCRPDFTPHTDGGDYVVVINSEKIAVTGNKEEGKEYFRHSRYIGNLKVEKLSTVREKNPTRILRQAVSGMLPKNKFRPARLKRLILVVGDKHPHEAQKPELITFHK